MQKIIEKSLKLCEIPPKERGGRIYHPFLNAETDMAKVKRRIRKAEAPHDIFLMVSREFSLVWLGLVREYMTNKEFSELLGEAWKTAAYPNIQVAHEVAAEWFRKARKTSLMNSREYEMYKKLPSRKKLYRGVRKGSSVNGLSWTDSDKNLDEPVCVSFIPKEQIYMVYEGYPGMNYVAEPGNIKYQ